MKLIIQIPCLNEEAALPATCAALPRHVDGFDRLEIMVVDDGSSDRTVQTARELGVDHVVRMHGNQGLARAFMAGLAACLDKGANVIVNTDADNQYVAADIGLLTRPILDDRADMVIGSRPFHSMAHFSPFKRLLQSIGSKVVRALSGADVQDSVCGFRAMSRHTAMRLNVFTDFTYTIETVIQAGRSNLRVLSVPIRVNGPTRPSRLFRGNVQFVLRSIMTMLVVYVIYRPTQNLRRAGGGFPVARAGPGDPLPRSDLARGGTRPRAVLDCLRHFGAERNLHDAHGRHGPFVEDQSPAIGRDPF